MTMRKETESIQNGYTQKQQSAEVKGLCKIDM